MPVSPSGCTLPLLCTRLMYFKQGLLYTAVHNTEVRSVAAMCCRWERTLITSLRLVCGCGVLWLNCRNVFVWGIVKIYENFMRNSKCELVSVNTREHWTKLPSLVACWSRRVVFMTALLLCFVAKWPAEICSYLVNLPLDTICFNKPINWMWSTCQIVLLCSARLLIQSYLGYFCSLLSAFSRSTGGTCLGLLQDRCWL